MVTQEDLNFIFDYQVKELYKVAGIKCKLCVDVQTNTLIVNITDSVLVAELKDKEEHIAIAAYLKLGCKKISFYCYQHLIWDYNADICPDQLTNMTAAVLSSPSTVIENEIESPHLLPVHELQFEDNWISLEAIAKTLGVDRKFVEDETEQLEIDLTRRSGIFGLSDGNLEIYLDRRHNQTKERFNQMLHQAPSKPSRQSTATRLKAVPNVFHSNGATSTTEEGLSLPESFDMMSGRQRRPDIPTALKLAISALPDGDDQETRKAYVRQIAMRENVEDFVAALASRFEGSAKFKNAATTAKEIYNAARSLWDEYLDSPAA